MYLRNCWRLKTKIWLACFSYENYWLHQVSSNFRRTGVKTKSLCWFNIQSCIQKFFGKTVFSRGIQGRSLKRHNRELWTTIFSYKHVWIAWVEATYYGKCNYYALINCIRHFVRGEFIQNYFKIFSFLLLWDKDLGSHTGWPVAKPLWIRP